MPHAPEYLHLIYPNTEFEALLYGRASRDPGKQGTSVKDQLDAGRTLCRTHNWAIADEFKDVDLSASRHATKARDDFEELLETIRQGPARPGIILIVVAFEASRYYRDLEAYVRLRNACQEAGVLLCYKGTVYDLSRGDDRRATAMDAIAAEGEADDIRDRNLRTARRTAEAGQPHGQRLYGYERDYQIVNGKLRCVRQYEHPVQGPYVRQLFERFDAGHSLKALVRWLKSEEAAGRPNGGEWTELMVRRMLRNRAYLGERVHRGTWRPATWPAIRGLDTPAGQAMFNRAVAKLSDPSRRTQRGVEVSHLMSGIASCAHCGDHALMYMRTDRGVPYMVCREKADVRIREDWLDAFVEEAVVEWFSRKREATAALVPDDGDVEEKVAAAQRRINAYEEQLGEAKALSEEFDEETGRFRLSSSSLASMEQRLVPKLEHERKKLRDMTGVSPLLLSLLNAADPDAVWNGRPPTDGDEGLPGLALEQKREVLRTVARVRVRKVIRRGLHRLEPGRVAVAFIGQPEFRGGPLRVPGSGIVPAADAASGTR